jgi:hypothetical protein
MTKTRIYSRRTVDTYKVEGDIENLTNAELIDFCDLNNFGGYVLRSGNVATVEVYTD